MPVRSWEDCRIAAIIHLGLDAVHPRCMAADGAAADLATKTMLGYGELSKRLGQRSDVASIAYRTPHPPHRVQELRLMYLLPCPQCQHANEVSAARAGDAICCDGCKQSIAVPKLGQLRSLDPVGTDTPAGDAPTARRETPIVFPILAFLAIALTMIAGYSALRYSFTDVYASNQKHLEVVATMYPTMSAADLVGEMENMEKRDIEEVGEHSYVKVVRDAQSWFRTAIGSAIAAVVAVAGAVWVIRRGAADPSASAA